ncbi:hypothetical protein ACOSP7_010043 [Xanthoceras sorbifolium]
MKEKTAKSAKADLYKDRLRKAWRMIKRLQKELPDCSIDRFLMSSEYLNAIDFEFERGVTDTKYLISRVDPNFDFEKLEEIRVEEWAKGDTTEKVGSPTKEEDEDSLLMANVELTEEEVDIGSE